MYIILSMISPKINIFLYACATCFELPSKISIMIQWLTSGLRSIFPFNHFSKVLTGKQANAHTIFEIKLDKILFIFSPSHYKYTTLIKYIGMLGKNCRCCKYFVLTPDLLNKIKDPAEQIFPHPKS